MMAISPLLQMQTSLGLPLAPTVALEADPLLPPLATRETLAHFWDEIYDLSPESHLSRFLGTLLGDSGTGQLRKRFVYMHLSQVLATSHFYDLDRLFAEVFGISRLFRERLPFDPYNEAATDAEWEAILAADASYRNRVEQFVQAISWGGTPNGMVQAASAIISHPVRVYESYSFLDEEAEYEPGDPVVTEFTYGDLEGLTYGDLENRTYAEMEGAVGYQTRSIGSRSEFILRPLRSITEEERYHLLKALQRLKPAEAMLTIDPQGISTKTQVQSFAASSDSTYWHVQSRVLISPEHSGLYARYEEGGAPVEQPRRVFSEYQGEEWSYNADVIRVTAYAESADGHVISPSNYDRVSRSRTTVDYLPRFAMLEPGEIARGMAVRDGIMVAPVAGRT